jgi:hypothetical protein
MKFLTFLTTVVLLTATNLFAQTEPTDSDGDGYYNISTLSHLRWISENDSSWTWNFELDNDINAADTEDWNDGAGWSPIGNNTTKFKGEFKGQGYEIDSLYVYRSSDYVGFFGDVDSAKISKLGITNCYIKGAEYAGGLAGNITYTEIQMCYTTGEIYNTASYIGGLVGRNYSSSQIKNSYSRASVTCNASGYAHYSGGFAGYSAAYIENCYSTGDVTSTRSGIGGFTGTGGYNGAWFGSFWDTETSGYTTSGVGTGKTTDEMKADSTFKNVGWNFDLVWAIDEDINDGYPYIDDRTIPVTNGIEPTDTDSDGYYNISSLAHLVWLSERDSTWDWNLELDNDIDASDTYYWENLEGFSPIGNANTSFVGKIDGNDYVIDSLYIRRINTSFIAFIGRATYGSEITNLGVTNCSIYGYDYVGAIGGYFESCIIKKCFSTGEVISNGDNGYVAGLLGGCRSNRIENSFSHTSVQYKGSDNYPYLSGFTNSTYYTQHSVIKNCYSTGEIIGNGNGDGFSSYHYSENCFWDTLTSGQSSSNGGTGKTTSQMKNDSTFLDANWNFNVIWAIDEDINDGYPYIDDKTIPVTVGIEPTDTDDNGYRNISTLAHLVWLSENDSSWTWNLELDNDIDASDTYFWETLEGFSPIGNGITYYTGNFDGNGFEIDSLYINRPEQTFIGLFGYVRYGSVQNVGVTNCYYIGSYPMGGLVGQLQGSVLKYSFAEGQIKKIQGWTYSQTSSIGGLIGASSNDEVTYCYADVDVIATQYCTIIGGFAGYVVSSDILRCFSRGDVINNGSNSDYMGGFVGSAPYSYNPYIYKCYSTGEVSGSSSIKGGFSGYGAGYHLVKCFWDTESSGMATSSAGTGKTTAEMKTDTTFLNENWNLRLYWSIDEDINDGYPFINNRSIPVTTAIEPTDTDDNGYINISSLAHLVWVSNNSSSWSSNFELDNDIDASDTYYWDNNQGFSPIGNNATDYTGVFEGKGFEIDSLFIDFSELSNPERIGLFSYISNSEIKNLGITNLFYKSSYMIGGITGSSNGSTIKNCYTAGEIINLGNYSGGISGVHYGEQILNCYSHCNVKGLNFVGGLVGSQSISANIINSFATGYIEATNGEYVGGISGQGGNNTVVVSCFWDTETCGQSTSAGGIGKTTSEMKQDTTFRNAGWDFGRIWAIDEDINEGYPHIYNRTIPVTTGIEPTDTDSDGYKNISTLGHLVWISENDSSWTWNFELDNDINARDTYWWETLEGWLPIGHNTIKYTGEFLGNNFKIDSLYFDRNENNYHGFFGFTHHAEIKDLDLPNVEIYSNALYCGALSGRDDYTYVKNCYSSGEIENSADSYTGGLIGMKNYDEISLSYSECNIESQGHAGGLLGYVGSVYINNCYATGDMNGETYTGGLIGYNSQSEILNCYSNGEVTGNTDIGGLIGFNSSGSYQNSFWDTETSGTETSAGGDGKTTSEMKQDSTFKNAEWNFFAVWDMDAGINNGYPYINDRTIPVTTGVEPTDIDSDGSKNISTLAHLVWLSQRDSTWDWNLELDNDINASDTYYWETLKGFSPIGNGTTHFTGTFDGNGFKIDSIYIFKPLENYSALFGSVAGGNISNLGVTNCNITGKTYVGAIIGYANYSSNCLIESYSTGVIKGTVSSVGGIVGSLSNYSTIKECYSNCEVFNDGSNSGGLVGSAGDWCGMYDSYSTGNIKSGGDNNGGVIGHLWDHSTVENCYSLGSVTSSGSSNGGLVGYNGNSSYVNDSFWDTETSGMSSSSGGTGKTTAEMKFDSTFIDAGWNYDTLWNTNVFYHNSYPYLQDVLKETVMTNLIYPNDSSYVYRTDNISFIWSKLDSALEYRLLISESYTFDTAIVDTTVSDTTENLSGFEFDVDYFWKVIGINGTDSSNWSSIRMFTPKLLPPSLEYPAANAINVSTSDSLSWGASNGATSYEVQIATNDDFSSLVLIDTVTTLKKTFSDLDYYTSYYWRVRAIKDDVVSNWSETRIFKTKLSVPLLSTPVDEAISQLPNLTLEWNYVTGATNYDIQISEYNDFNTTVFDDNALSNTKEISGLEYETVYYWRVKAHDDDGSYGDWSEVWSFTTRDLPVTPPILYLPFDLSENTGKAVALRWCNVYHAISYDIQLSTSEDFSSTIINENTTLITKSLTGLSSSTTYYWRVRAISNLETGEWSETWEFNTGTLDYRECYGYNNSQISSKIFAYFDAVDLNDDGDIDIVGTDLFYDKIVYLENDGNGIFTENDIIENFDEPMAISVVDVDGDGDKDIISTSAMYNKMAWFENDGNEEFTTHFFPTNFDGERDVEGVDFDKDNDIDFVYCNTNESVIGWFENDGSENFTNHILAYNVDWPNEIQIFDIDMDGFLDILCPTGNDYLFSWYKNDGEMNFTKNQIDEVDSPAISMYATDIDRDGDTDILGGTNFELILYINNGNGTFNSSIVFESTEEIDVWHIQTRDINYDGDEDLFVTMQGNDNHNVIIFENTGNYAFAEYDIYDDLPDADNMAIGDFNNDNYLDIVSSGFSENGKVMMHKNIDMSTDLISPLNDNFVYTLTPELSWEDTGADKYNIQLSTSQTFDDLIVNDTIANSQLTIDEGLLGYEVVYYWRVRGFINEEFKCWSDVWHFEILDATLHAPVLATPADESTDLDISVTLEWSSVDYATNYDIQLSEDETFTTTIIDENLTDTSKTVMGLITKLLISGEQELKMMMKQDLGQILGNLQLK